MFNHFNINESSLQIEKSVDHRKTDCAPKHHEESGSEPLVVTSTENREKRNYKDSCAHNGCSDHEKVSEIYDD